MVDDNSRSSSQRQWLPCLLVFKTRGVRSTFYGIGLLVLIFISSLLCDLVYIAMTRYILRRIAGIDHIPEIFVMIFLNLLVLVIPILGPVYGGAVLAKYAPQAGAMVLFSIMFNAIDVLGGLAALLWQCFFFCIDWPGPRSSGPYTRSTDSLH